MAPDFKENRHRVDTNAIDNATLPRHRWYPIKEGFSANFVNSSFAELTMADNVSALAVEPFSGSGTTPVECALMGVECAAFEVNPFLAFVGNTKLQQVPFRKFRNHCDGVLRGLRVPRKSPLEGFSTFSEDSGKDKWLFNRNVLRAFTGGWTAVSDSPPRYRSLLKLALLRSIMDNCNAYPDGKCLRYKRLPDYSCFSPESLSTSFERYSNMISEDLEIAPLNSRNSSVKCMDSRLLDGKLLAEKFDFCVTSPPYLNSFDYSDVYRPELYLGGFVSTNAELMKIRLRTVRSHIQANWTAPSKSGFGSSYAKVLADLVANKEALWNHKILEMVQAYFEDMERLLIALSDRANPGAMLKIAVATSAYAGIVIPVDFILAEIAEAAGWELQDIRVVRRIRSSAQHWKHEDANSNVPELRESVVVMKYPS